MPVTLRTSGLASTVSSCGRTAGARRVEEGEGEGAMAATSLGPTTPCRLCPRACAPALLSRPTQPTLRFFLLPQAASPGAPISGVVPSAPAPCAPSPRGD